MSTIGGLPAHVLLVHVVVVLIPLSAVLLLFVAVFPRIRERLGTLTAALAILSLISVPITTQAGEWLERRVPRTALLRTHTHLGDSMLPWAIGLAVVAVAVAVEQRRHHRHIGAAAPYGRRPVHIVLALLAVVVALGSLFTVYRIGDSGARAAWTGRFSATPLPRAVGQD